MEPSFGDCVVDLPPRTALTITLASEPAHVFVVPDVVGQTVDVEIREPSRGARKGAGFTMVGVGAASTASALLAAYFSFLLGGKVDSEVVAPCIAGLAIGAPLVIVGILLATGGSREPEETVHVKGPTVDAVPARDAGFVRMRELTSRAAAMTPLSYTFRF